MRLTQERQPCPAAETGDLISIHLTMRFAMNAEPATPMTFGQLSTWVDDQNSAGRRFHAIDPIITPVNASMSVAHVLGALHELRARHESLRTTYDFFHGARPWQAVHPNDARDLPVQCISAASGLPLQSVALEIAIKMRENPFNLAAKESWRAAIITADGRPVQVILVLHHLAADLWAARLLDKDFRAILKGDLLGPAETPRELAMAQNSERWRERRQATEQYQRTVLTKVARGSGLPMISSPEAAIMAVLRSSVALPAAAALARSLSITLPSLLLAAYAYAAHQKTHMDVILLRVMFSNRSYPGTTNLVSSMNQTVPIVSERRVAEPFGQFAKRIYWASLQAYEYACYDRYVAKEIQNDVAAANGPIHPGFVFNFFTQPTAEPAGSPAVASAPSWSVRHETPHRAGPAFYLEATQAADLVLVGRVMWEDFDRPALDAFLVTIYCLLTGP
jgi:hypothetical protein